MKLFPVRAWLKAAETGNGGVSTAIVTSVENARLGVRAGETFVVTHFETTFTRNWERQLNKLLLKKGGLLEKLGVRYVGPAKLDGPMPAIVKLPTKATKYPGSTSRKRYSLFGPEKKSFAERLR